MRQIDPRPLRDGGVAPVELEFLYHLAQQVLELGATLRGHLALEVLTKQVS